MSLLADVVVDDVFCTVYDEGLAWLCTSLVLIMDVNHMKKSCTVNHLSSSRAGFY